MVVPVFISGIGTNVGKSVASATVCLALQADYWKPVQAGTEDITDTTWVSDIIAKDGLNAYKEAYCLAKPASPHIAAAAENQRINLEKIVADLQAIISTIDNGSDQPQYLVIEGAGGLMVPLNETNFIIDLIAALKVPLLLVSRNYLGSINHSLLSAAVCRQYKLDVRGWIFNTEYEDYEDQIAEWSNMPALGIIPSLNEFNYEELKLVANTIEPALKKALC
ncbi:MAG TPA: dethiobiotin synthase [Parasegetibacter sp.]